MSDYDRFQVGAFVSPLTASTTNSLLTDADPALAVTLAYYQAVIQGHLGARWDAEVVKAGLPLLAGKLTTLAIPYDPLPFMAAVGFSPPFLSLFATTEETVEWTRHFYSTETQWKLLLVLPPLDAAQYLQLHSILRAASKVIVNATEQGYEPTYQAGARFAVAAGIQEIKIGKSSYGSIPGLDTKTFFPTLAMDIVVRERRMPTPGLDVLAGIDGNVQLTDVNGTDVIAPFALDLP
jgi:hypothetical protein